jgi:uncharacterized protein YgiB involved in biofilm formation
MKRSSSVRLTLMSAATAAGLSACGETPAPVAPFASVEQCVTSGVDRAKCETGFEEARKAHAEKAPRFATREECLKSADVNDCTPTQVRNQDGSMTSMFVPALGGFLLGQALANRQGGGGFSGGYSGGGPLYRSRDNPSQFRDTGGLTSRQGGSNALAPYSESRPTASRPPNVNTTTISRGGFGSSSSSFGSASS